MPNAAHQIAVALLADNPELLSQLAERLLGRKIATDLRVGDSTTRFVETDEARPDLALETSTAWVALEVQGQADTEKWRRWPVMLSLRLSQTGKMGDLVVLTFSRAVASWAEQVVRLQGPLGTRLDLTPVVLLIADEGVDAVLDESHPALAFFAAWSMQDRYGPEARRVVDRALVVAGRLPEPLRGTLQRAIMKVLHEKMVSYLKELAMDIDNLPNGPAAQLFWNEAHAKGLAEGKAEGKAEGEAHGKAESIVAILTARRIAFSDSQRYRILACTDATLLDAFIQRAVTAESADEVFTSRHG